MQLTDDLPNNDEEFCDEEFCQSGYIPVSQKASVLASIHMNYETEISVYS